MERSVFAFISYFYLVPKYIHNMLLEFSYLGSNVSFSQYFCLRPRALLRAFLPTGSHPFARRFPYAIISRLMDSRENKLPVSTE